MLNIILFGPPGSGKGTQSKYITDEHHLIHVSTGDLLRLEVANDTKLGQKVKDYINKGHLVPDEIILEMVRQKIKQNLNQPGFVFDGFPRTVSQAENLDQIFASLGLKLDAALYLKVPDDETVIRLTKRATVSGREDDADPKVIANRVVVYNRETAPLIDYYKQLNKAIEIDGVGPIELIAGRTRLALAKFR